MKTNAIRLAAVLCLALGIAPVLAQTAYPNRPIRMVVAFPPGGGTDINARLIGAQLQASLGQTVVIENRPGANGLIGTTMVAKSPADGYTLSMGAGGPLTINHQVMKNVPLDPLKDLAPVATVSRHVLALVVHPSFSVSTVQELIAAIKPKIVTEYTGWNYLPYPELRRRLKEFETKALGRITSTHTVDELFELKEHPIALDSGGTTSTTQFVRAIEAVAPKEGLATFYDGQFGFVTPMPAFCGQAGQILSMPGRSRNMLYWGDSWFVAFMPNGRVRVAMIEEPGEGK